MQNKPLDSYLDGLLLNIEGLERSFLQKIRIEKELSNFTK
jgi:hypothetical protein